MFDTFGAQEWQLETFGFRLGVALRESYRQPHIASLAFRELNYPSATASKFSASYRSSLRPLPPR